MYRCINTNFIDNKYFSICSKSFTIKNESLEYFKQIMSERLNEISEGCIFK